MFICQTRTLNDRILKPVYLFIVIRPGFPWNPKQFSILASSLYLLARLFGQPYIILHIFLTNHYV